MAQRNVRRQLSRREYVQKPYLLWNAFVSLTHMEEYQDLTPLQRVAHLAIWYDSEVQNGGHLQYFENRGTIHLQETLAALDAIGAHRQREILEQAARHHISQGRNPIQSVEEYVARARAGEYDTANADYHGCRPTTIELLEHFLMENQDEFVEWV